MRTFLILASTALILLSANLCRSIVTAEPSSVADARSQMAAPERKVTMKIKSAVPVKQALDLLFKDRGRSYSFVPGPSVSGTGALLPGEARVSVDLSNVTFEDAVGAVARSAGLDYRLDKAGDYVFSPIGQRQEPGVPSLNQRNVLQYGGAASQTQMNSQFGNSPRFSRNQMANPGVLEIRPHKGRTFDMRLEQVNVFDVIRQMMALTGQDYVLDFGSGSNVMMNYAPRIDAKLTGVSLEQFLSSIDKSAGVKSKFSDGQWLISWRPDLAAMSQRLDQAGRPAQYTLRYLVFTMEPSADAALLEKFGGGSVGLPPLNADYGVFLRELSRRYPGYRFSPVTSGACSFIAGGSAEVENGPAVGDPMQVATHLTVNCRQVREPGVRLDFELAVMGRDLRSGESSEQSVQSSRLFVPGQTVVLSESGGVRRNASSNVPIYDATELVAAMVMPGR